MKFSKTRAAAGAGALVATAFGQLAQFAVAPAHISGGSAADQVSAIAGHGGRMQLGLWLDLLALAIIPAVLFLGELAGSRRFRLAAAGTVVAFVGVLGVGYLLANDVLLYAASQAKDQAGAVEVVSAYESSGVVVVATVLGVLGNLIGLILLGIALIRARTVPVWVGVSVITAPVLSVVGEASAVLALAIGAYALQLVAFTACAVALLRAGRTQNVAQPVVTPVAA
ncbi:hypothetical protein AB0H43_26080 [Hamadaea sp. NPDC050747]|uniref:hypothetical protein n=1 Tax=Hamadaea sp. NPDC050747 TaxID=3155789 RepID=UPI0033CD5528